MISLVSPTTRPADWARVWDTNRMTYQFHSTNSGQTNFQFQFTLIYWTYDAFQTDIGTFNLYPDLYGNVEFNPSTIYKNYLSYDYDASIMTMKECLKGAGKFSLSVFEYYGTPPVKQTIGSWSGETGIYEPLKVYNGAQQFIPYDYTTLNPSGNKKWVMSGATSGQFLTDATEYRLGNDDLAFLYFLADRLDRPTRVRYTIYYNCNGGGISPDKSPDYLGIGKNIYSDPYTDQATAQSSPEYNLDAYINPNPIVVPTICSAITYSSNFVYLNLNTIQYYFPMGPYQLISGGTLTSYKDTWLYYKVDLMSGNTVLNKNPFYVYNTCKETKYGRWQVAWLNPHGGFDCFTFDRKNEINYKLEKNIYKQRLSPNPIFSTYDAGDRVYNNKSTQEIVLRSNTLTQKEAQLLVQMAQSSRVYVITIYTYAGVKYPYGVPYIISSDSIGYEQKINDKEVYVEIKIRPANENMIQND